MITADDPQYFKRILKPINETPILLSLLYDLDLLPEQVEQGSERWKWMVTIVSAFQLGRETERALPLADPLKL